MSGALADTRERLRRREPVIREADSRMTCGRNLRALVVARANFSCEYCHITGRNCRSSTSRRALHDAGARADWGGGMANRAAACAHCNRFKADFVTDVRPPAPA
jgi:hypothetical protein